MFEHVYRKRFVEAALGKRKRARIGLRQRDRFDGAIGVQCRRVGADHQADRVGVPDSKTPVAAAVVEHVVARA